MARKRNVGSELVKAVETYLQLTQKRKDFCFWRNNTGAFKTAAGGFYRFGAVGSPDFIVVKDGYFIGLEVKAGSGRLSEAQRAFKEMIKTHGGEYHEIRSIEDLIEIGL